MNVLMAEVRSDPTGPPHRGLGVVRHAVRGHGAGAVIFQVNVGRHVQRGADPEEGIKAVVHGAAAEAFGEVDVVHLGSGFHPIEAEMPLADHGRCVAVLPEVVGHRDAVVFQQGCIISVQHARLELSAPRIAAGEQGIATRTTNPRG